MAASPWPGRSPRSCCWAWPPPPSSSEGASPATMRPATPAPRTERTGRTERTERTGLTDQRRVDHDVVDIAVTGVVEVAPAGDQPQFTVEGGEVHRLGR